MEKITTRKKRIVIIGVAILVAVLSILLAVFGLSKTSKIYEFCLNERDVAIEINDTVRLKVVSDDGKNQNRKVKVSWVSTSPSVATVGEDVADAVFYLAPHGRNTTGAELVVDGGNTIQLYPIIPEK